MILIGVGVSGATRSYYSGDKLADSRVFTVDSAAVRLVVEARAAMPDNKERAGKGASSWGIAWDYRSDGDYECCRLTWRNLDYGELTDKRVLEVEVGRVSDGEFTLRDSFSVDRGVNLFGGYNTLTLEWDSGTLNIFVGARNIERVGSVVCEMPELSQCKVVAQGRVEVASVVVESVADRKARLLTSHTSETVSHLLRRSLGNPTVGEWHYLDRETDDARARLGGKYTLYVIPYGERYLILYGGGAVVNADSWEPMMVKGELTPTRFAQHYDLVWYDSMMERMDDECYATVDDEGVLTLQFPLSRSRLRFYRSAISLR